MIQERYVVLAYFWWPFNKDDADEISWHYTIEKAVKTANAYHAKTGTPCRVDLDCVEFVPGRTHEPLWSEADKYGVGFAGSTRWQG